MESLHISLHTTHSGCKPSSFLSSFTHSLQVFLFLHLPLHLIPATSIFLQTCPTQYWWKIRRMWNWKKWKYCLKTTLYCSVEEPNKTWQLKIYSCFFCSWKSRKEIACRKFSSRYLWWVWLFLICFNSWYISCSWQTIWLILTYPTNSVWLS